MNSYSYKIVNKYSKLINHIKKPSIYNNGNELLNPYLKEQFINTISINPFLNIYFFKKISKFIHLFLKKKGTIIFILPNQKHFNDLNINEKFIDLLKKHNYRHFYINPSKPNIINDPGFLTNIWLLNKVKKKDIYQKKFLIFNLNTDLIYTENLIKEATLLRIPVISVVNNKNIIPNLLYPLIGNINLKKIIFYYFFISKILKNVHLKKKKK